MMEPKKELFQTFSNFFLAALVGMMVGINYGGLAGLRKNGAFLPVPDILRRQMKLRDKYQYCLLVSLKHHCLHNHHVHDPGPLDHHLLHDHHMLAHRVPPLHRGGGLAVSINNINRLTVDLGKP